MSGSIIIVFSLLSQLVLAALVRTDCEIEPFFTNAPLIIKPFATDILYPRYGESVLRFTSRYNVDFVCPGGNVLLDNNSTGSPVIHASCFTDALFSVSGKQVHWTQVRCSRSAVAVGRWTDKFCPGGREAEIGFDLGENRFIKTITVCFDSAKQIALYTYYKIISSIGAQATGTNRPAFGEDRNFYHIGNQAVNSLYLRAPQRQTVNELLGLTITNTTYIDDGALFFLARGHMAARSDFFYPAEQIATFRYINAAPQWQTFNLNNWAIAERDTRNYASINNVTLEVWTGTFGITTLPHAKTGRSENLYIYVNGEERGLPIPAVYWKVVYNSVTKRGVALVGLNNPYERDVTQYVYCNDVSEKLQWLRWNKANITRGYSYACALTDFRKAVWYAPDLNVTGLLL